MKVQRKNLKMEMMKVIQSKKKNNPIPIKKKVIAVHGKKKVKVKVIKKMKKMKTKKVMKAIRMILMKIRHIMQIIKKEMMMMIMMEIIMMEKVVQIAAE